MAAAQMTMKEIISFTVSKNGVYGGIRFDEADSTFDNQPALNLLPKLLTLPFETLIGICTHNLSEKNKDMMVGLLADACCERIEHFITQVVMFIGLS